MTYCATTTFTSSHSISMLRQARSASKYNYLYMHANETCNAMWSIFLSTTVKFDAVTIPPGNNIL